MGAPQETFTMNQMGGAAACLACIICAFLTIGLIAPLMYVREYEGVVADSSSSSFGSVVTFKVFSGPYYRFRKIEGSSTITQSGHYDNCDSSYEGAFSGAGYGEARAANGATCWFEWCYIMSLFFAVVSLCTTVGGAANAHPQALAGAAGVNFCTGLWCMICASIYTGNMGGAPAGANFSYAALWLCWLLSWIVAGICGAAHSQGGAGDGMATGPKEEVVVVTAV